ncbi:MAG: hypothetical protein KGL39_54810 [Patescibacteria group bacterium]|nr:hypothetical protein [Patescibacteria group bacterium]
MWDLEPTDEFNRRAKRFSKKHSRELKAVLTNLARVQTALREGASPQRLPFGFVHGEQAGVLALDQRGGGGSLMEARLYIYLDQNTKTLHAITLGDKRTQADDVDFAAKFVRALTDKNETNRGKSDG